MSYIQCCAHGHGSDVGGYIFLEFEEHVVATYLDASGFNGRRKKQRFCLEAEQDVVANPIWFIVLISCTPVVYRERR